MAGIAGILRIRDQIALAELQSMTDILKHRGTDEERYWINPTCSVGFGERDDFTDEHFLSNRPMNLDNGRFTIVFDGKIYNYSILRERLTKKGIQLVSNCDSEIVLNLYKLKKEKCLDEVEGVFSFAIWDEHEQKMFCARDRFGEKPFYYHHIPGQLFVFASEIKGIHKYGIPKSPNESLIYNFFLYNYRTGNAGDKSETFFTNIKKLPGASYLVVEKNLQVSVSKYWDIEWKNQHDEINESIAIDRLRHLLNESITNRLMGASSVGASLSGGVDSSGIVCWVDKYFKDPVTVDKTFSARFKDHNKDEGGFMESVIRTTSVKPYFTWPDASSLLKDLDKLCFHQDEPFGSASIFAQWEVMKLANEKSVKVILDGQGADEVFAGYHPFYRFYINWLYNKNRSKYNQELKIFNEIHDPNFGGYLKQDLRYHLSGIKGNLLKRFHRSPCLFSDGFERAHRNSNHQVHSPVNLNHYLYLSLLEGNGLEDLLRYADRSSTAFSLQVRLPYLDHKLVEFVFSLPDHLKLKDGWTKYILRKALDGITPSEITWRRDKIGYEPPQKQWLESDLFYDYLDSCFKVLVNENILNKNLSRQQKLNVGWQIIMTSKLYG